MIKQLVNNDLRRMRNKAEVTEFALRDTEPQSVQLSCGLSKALSIITQLQYHGV